MINNIIAFSVKNKLIIGLMTLVWIAAGIWSITKVPLDAVPDITNNQVQVITQAPNLGTIDIEQFVTYPVEVAMANLPGVIEIRSVSRFGLSVVTVVFEDDMETYLPRQLVSEKLVEVQGDIPAGFGTPEMGPISTGLGEIYQYTLQVDSAFRDAYSLSDLRTFQDWIIRRQMAMVPGVVEVNAFGGNIKQYEVAINPDELNAIDLSVSDVFEALEANNQNTGGAYIEKDHYANFIRGEGLARSLEDIEKIVITTRNGLPITIGNVAQVQFGTAIRYGALTKDGQGEAVGGMMLMLKGANSNDVIKAVQDRIVEIQKSLPEGVSIEPFLDRSTLIARTTGTVSENLILGALIVIFVLVFLLGNWRGGLIVASTIPLSLLFAFILMNVFDVWANLMSLGAIDFGIIVDGAVIIVEGTVFLIHDKFYKKRKLNAEERDEVAIKSSSKMMNAAFFGQLIILIVFIPILALEGVEGKMFRPMALTFMFAMVGVIILCLTYVPMMSAWFLRRSKSEKKSYGDKFVKKVGNFYSPLLVKALNHSKLIVISAVVLLGVSVFIFSRLGGEFIPQLDEGDLAFHAIVNPGSALSETIDATTKIEKLLMENFPEVKHVVSRIGVADVPTDPMPMDVADCIVILKPRSKWVSAETKEELVEKMKTVVSQVPGVNFEFTQPIEMRFNELLTGVREDVAIKLFGEDLDVLSAKAEEIGRLIADIPGIGDMKVEATDGLPQMTVRYDRYKLAQYGLNISDLNQLIETAFAGGVAGQIFEGEKRFDLVVRFDERHRSGIEDLQNTYVSIPNGSKIPLREVAHITYEPGPMQISRDNTNRRTYVGVNVRGRDVQSVVTDIQARLDADLELAPGYYIRYGGAFENLERAANRLKIVVPLALALIFILIFFALRSIKQTTMIYIAIPLAAIGGIFALWIRDMPFSISAGIGFIVLFGVAVLNGLVLISGWNELKDEGMTDVNERIVKGSLRRIRPIMLTALTDILGFLPMAISSSAGAEVQRPLATVVIGGMISATLLTLFVLPILYKWVETRSAQVRVPKRFVTAALAGVVVLASANSAVGQTPESVKHVEEAISIAIKNNGKMQAARYNVEISELGKKSALNIPQADFGVQYGQYNSYENDFSFSIQQKLAFPTVYSSQRKLAKIQLDGSELDLAIEKNELTRNVRQAWYDLAYLNARHDLLEYQNELFTEFSRAARIRYETNATSLLEKTSADMRVNDVDNQLNMIAADVDITIQNLRILLNDTSRLVFNPDTIMEYGGMEMAVDSNPILARIELEWQVAEAEKSVESAKMLPHLSVGYFNQSLMGIPTESGNIATSSDRYDGINAGIGIPLFFSAQKAEIKKATLRGKIAESDAFYVRQALEGAYRKQLFEIEKFRGSLNYYKNSAVPQADLIIENATKSFKGGAIDYIEYFQNLNQALEIKQNYLETLNSYNQALIKLDYLIGR
ncbi:CusA/CzcA family heavy metal efflux RND transporter [Cryomorpha ignava]|uniref:CusA/CzcA family heavy metal efflux RND transporter n=1 Tax=Cryomorpha ignava TaxID=101383 RepID=A0A7K3WM70_9FLAO|nr:CusA/CzcA family heavy metal efflux RND transporter [Cryomorpha ignava]NEN22618.1 CusA/CzcA family heavy metal efflux RND transporter [Cryomorpha ignava]